ncbi:hypothetical protein DLJ53_21815 [Acuticoccus sediminis]|uniref:Uncharacterized protein n=1 Tax=Acuticoccus sediminis TaxID=2184697 RepID=A0A8B2NU59_9HYPH|nr:hypothetical protein [Acuticoccus sediminis]RAH99186.1 hypothetical protein DLJ53_21815 [Acuticoccus sediminis]
MTARYDLEVFAGTDETVVFELVTVDQAALDVAGSTFTARILAVGELVGEATLTPAEADGATVLAWRIDRETTAALAERSMLAQRIAYRIDRETEDGRLRTYAHGAVNATSPGASHPSRAMHDTVVRDKPAVVRLTIDVE